MQLCFVRKIIIFLLFINPALFHADPAAVRFDPLPIARRLGSHEGSVLPEDFREAALVFSGIAPGDLPRYRGLLADVIAAAKTAFTGRPAGRAFGDDLLVFLHDRYLKRYAAEETSLDRLLDAGVYNCVSSSIFYLIVADALGLQADVVRTKDHAFVRVTSGGSAFDVETTNRYGFDPGRRKEFFDAFGTMTGFVYTPPSNYADRRNINRTEALSLILLNRIAVFAGTRDFASAVGVAVDLFALVQNEETMQSLIGCLSGFASQALEGGAYEAGYTVLDRAVSLYRDFDQVQEVRRMFVREWAGRLVEKKAFTEAEALIRREYARGKITPEDYRVLMLFRYEREAEAAAGDPGRGTMAALDLISRAKKELGALRELISAERAYAHNHILSLIEKDAFAEAQDALSAFLKEGRIDPADHRTLTVYRVQREASRAAERFGPGEALRIVEEALEAVTGDQTLLKTADVYAYNTAVKLIEEGNYREAASFLSEGKAARHLSSAHRNELLIHLYIARAEKAKKSGDHQAAAAALEEGLSALGSAPKLLNAYEVLMHNRMVEFYNAREYDQAEEVLLRGLAAYPGSSLLHDDLRKIRKLKER